MGVDGFRLDVINLISKQQDFPNDDQGDGRRFYTDDQEFMSIYKRLAVMCFSAMGRLLWEKCHQPHSNTVNSTLR